MTAPEQRMSEIGPAEVSQRSQASVTTPATSSPVQLNQVVVPSVAVLEGVSHIQVEVDRRIRHLTDLNEADKLKSQRSGNDTVWSKGKCHGRQIFYWGEVTKAKYCMIT